MYFNISPIYSYNYRIYLKYPLKNRDYNPFHSTAQKKQQLTRYFRFFKSLQKKLVLSELTQITNVKRSALMRKLLNSLGLP